VTRSAHVSAVLARLREHPVLRDRVFQGIAVKDAAGTPRTRYVTVWVGSPRRTVERLAGEQTTERYRITIHATSVDPDDVGVLDDAVTQQLLGWTPTIPGRNSRRMTSDGGDEMQYDGDLTPPLYWIPVTWELVTEPEASA
jgi:hypothetical protein